MPSPIRIAQVELGAEPGALGWPRAEYQVQRRDGVSAPITVPTPAAARDAAEALRAAGGGTIYRGTLSDGWHAALAEYPRTPIGRAEVA